MSDIVLRVEDLWKQYRLGLVDSKTLQADMQRWWAAMRGKEDPLLKIGAENKLDLAGDDYVWALQNINFEVNQGEVLGVIGKNGAGKSTLLKILSKVTAPTKGKIYVNGRIASLLEVGTGFHPELTGRENIFLNGAILGMKKHEIKTRLDEIVTFAGIEKYLDTPVKRYSSGMFVRLAFAVAAHLEPDILIVDEVLAVGDVEFQKKAIGKMRESSQSEGRTVLFVSHSMGAVQKLCKRAILLEMGKVNMIGSVEEVVGEYVNKIRPQEIGKIDNSQFEEAYVSKIQILDCNQSPSSTFSYNDKWLIHLEIKTHRKIDHFVAAIGISHHDTPVNTSWSKPQSVPKGTLTVDFEISGIHFRPGYYSLSLGLSSFERPLYFIENIATIEILDTASSVSKQVQSSKGGLILNQFKSKLSYVFPQ
ncbi:MAG: ABC transporter ATP-binding protein [Cyclobacteriaceae bacterium]